MEIALYVVMTPTIIVGLIMAVFGVCGSRTDNEQYKDGSATVIAFLTPLFAVLMLASLILMSIAQG